MLGAAALFFGLQLLAPIVGTLLAYGHCYHQRLQGVSGQYLEGTLARWGFLTSAGLSVLFFWFWPEGTNNWTQMPGLSWIARLTLIDPPQSDSSYPLVKMLVSLSIGLLAGLAARIHAFGLTRRLVREVPRFYRNEDAVGKR
ncbi:MAG: hypothetical protein KF760_16820 [Candidatus Eremiobacteraeota bacterium]|nr:hypothetical protein [Candidatus Eremiobacteraeota bacterium]MCW5866511.1 hypothetical protein [Candidatus Eremiobacteraeota bacterium]